MALVWVEKIKIGDEKIDAEHKEWFQKANDFLDAGDRTSRHAAGEAFSAYTHQHFFTEVALMRDIHYPYIATHVVDHDRLLSTLRKIFDVEIDDTLSKIELEEFVGFTLTKHITAFDAPLSVYIKRHFTSPVA
jgi:hemerythrin